MSAYRLVQRPKRNVQKAAFFCCNACPVHTHACTRAHTYVCRRACHAMSDHQLQLHHVLEDLGGLQCLHASRQTLPAKCPLRFSQLCCSCRTCRVALSRSNIMARPQNLRLFALTLLNKKARSGPSNISAAAAAPPVWHCRCRSAVMESTFAYSSTLK